MEDACDLNMMSVGPKRVDGLSNIFSPPPIDSAVDDSASNHWTQGLIELMVFPEVINESQICHTGPPQTQNV